MNRRKRVASKRIAAATLTLLAAALGSTTGCEIIAQVDRSQIDTSLGGSGGEGGSGGNGGAGGAGACTSADMCPGMDTACRTRTCTNGVCGFDDAPAGTLTGNQMVGDCQREVCDGMGAISLENDDSDVLDDMNDCTMDSCNAGMPENVPLAAGTACATNNGKVCDDMGTCVECNVAQDCTSLVCAQNQCVPASCADTTKNGDETDVDCGGLACAPCADGLVCSVAADCDSGVCTDGTCATPTCSDTIENGVETDVDCGGGTCAPCGPGLGCAQDTDCVGGSCSGSICLPTCTDNTTNGNETDVDCGGPTCSSCADTKACSVASDCESGVCTMGVCQAPTCMDTVQNGSETGTDCGGSCSPCADGLGCTMAGDCQSGVCTMNVCQMPSCTDTVKNGAETDADCGGGTCPTCDLGKVCSGNSDCTSTICVGSVCVVSLCGDNKITGAEACDDGNTNAGDGCDATCAVEMGYNCAGVPSVCTAICGDGMLHGPETCDDNNTNNGDGCSSACTIETGYACNGEPSACGPICGDGIKLSVEACDDNNTNNGDGCTSTCAVEPGFMCMGSPSMCTTACGDGIRAGLEACDDNNTTAGDGCNATCGIETGYTCNGSPSTCTPICGDNQIVGGEQCDDNNTSNGDGCSNTCQIEITCGAGEQKVVLRNNTPFPIPAGNATGIQSPVNVNVTGGVTKAVTVVHSLPHTWAGDVRMFLVSPQAAERDLSSGNGGNGDNYTNTTFDDAAATAITAGTAPFSGRFRPEQSLTTTGPGVDFLGLNALGTWNLKVIDDVTSDTGTLNSWSLALCVNPAVYCGNGTTEAGEQCDDGNTNNNDGCSNRCQTACGNGVLNTTEECDDGNTTANDGCSATCQIETGCAAGETRLVVTNRTSLPIPDGVAAGVQSPVTINDVGGVTKAFVVVHSLPHTWTSDVDLFLISPQSITREVSTDNGADLDNYTNTTFDDAAATSVTAGAAPFTGRFRPEQSLATTGSTDFRGLNAQGTWNLRVADDSTTDTGTLNAWSLAVCINPAAYCGNGTLEAGEECDDGNTNNADTCTNACRITDGCGDGDLDAGEQCDDDNFASGDGCSATCQVEITCAAGQTPVILTNNTSAPITDDNTFNNFPVSVASAGGVKKAVAVIGNISHTAADQLDIQLQSPLGTIRNLSDDNGTTTGVNYTSTFFDDAATTGIIAGTAPFNGQFRPEQSISTTFPADFLNENAVGTWNLQVRDDTTGTTGTFNSWTLALCLDTAAYCGNGTTNAGEQCDDGNTNNNDACTNECQLSCGNGQLNAGEQCDDGNTNNGDGCSSACQFDISCGVGEVPVILSNTTASAIPDNNGGVISTINVSQSGVVRRVIPAINVTHPVNGDLDIYLISPYGVQRELASERTGANFTATVFSDSTATAITSGTAPFSGTFRPTQTISNAAGFGNQTAMGNWLLRIGDDSTTVTGTLNSWSLALCIDPSVLSVCGNRYVEPNEQCDDGNTTNGDGCSSTCQLEITCGMGETLIVQRSADGPFIIQDNTPAGATSVINIANMQNVKRAVVVLNSVTHTWDTDLDISLLSPTGTTLDLSSDNGSTSDDYVSTVFDDTAATLVTAGSAPFRGRFRPEQALSGVNNQPANGNWSLRVVDDASGDAGVLMSWSIGLCVGP